jgi:hypothetical protein
MQAARAGALALSTIAILLASGCSGASGTEHSPGRAAENALASARSNERRLTHAQSLHLVEWASTFHSCVLAHDVSLGRLRISPTRIEMGLPPTAEADDVVPIATACGDRQGGPPQKASLQYQPGKFVLYLPKQCLLDAKVTSPGFKAP